LVFPAPARPCDNGATRADCTYEALYAYGGRSFTIWNAQSGQPVFDSGNAFEVITANRLGSSFNASNDDNEATIDLTTKAPSPKP
jgi:hypothetical protein